jgi:hypothetical protein
MRKSTCIVSHVWLALLCGAVLATAAVGTAQAEKQKGKTMSYGEDRDYLAKRTKVVELTNDDGACVAVTPEWQGRVMTSTCDGSKGASFGFINRKYIHENIDAGKENPHFNNIGAEERLWLCPEGGQYSLWFKHDAKQELANWFTPPAFNVGAWKVTATSKNSVEMQVPMKFENTAETTFSLDVSRKVHLLSADDFETLFGAAAAKIAGQPGVKMVAYETVNTITNRGADFSKEKGLTSIWILGMMNVGPETIIMVPYKPGPESELGKVVASSYFGEVPADRLKVTPEAVLFRADGKYRSKIGTSQKRARNVLGSIDFAGGVLTLVNFTMPDDPTKTNYVNNLWKVPQEHPFNGDVANSYNDGPNDLGAPSSMFYEIESIAPALVLKTGESLSHSHRTIHIKADMDTLRQLAKETLGVDLDAVKKAMLSE